MPDNTNTDTDEDESGAMASFLWAMTVANFESSLAAITMPPSYIAANEAVVATPQPPKTADSEQQPEPKPR
jgi:hypothetical protein